MIEIFLGFWRLKFWNRGVCRFDFSGGPSLWLVDSHLLSVSTFLCAWTFYTVCLPLLFGTTSHIGLVTLILTSLPLQRPYLQIWLLSEVLGSGASTYEIRRDIIQSITLCPLNPPNSCPSYRQNTFENKHIKIFWIGQHLEVQDDSLHFQGDL